MELFQNLFQGKKLNATEIALKNKNNKYQELDKYLENINTKLEETKPVVGWTNPNPKVGFADTTVTTSVSFSDYSYYEITFKGFCSNGTVLSTGMIPTNSGTTMLYAENSSQMFNRGTMAPSGNTIRIGNCGNNNYITPQQIIFYK